MKAAYGTNWRADTVNFFDTLKGLAGHYDTDKKLLGVRADNHATELNPYVLTCQPNPCRYVPTNTAIQLMTSPENAKWVQQFYTGDYDIHEIYSNTNKIIPEATPEKIRALNKFNEFICNLSSVGGVGVPRCGSFELDGGLVHIIPGNYYAMFQHGDQATYKMNQHLEHGKKAGKVNIVDAVNRESDDPLAWCVKGDWFVTMNLAEHRDFRGLMNLIAPNHWSKLGRKRKMK